MLHAFRQRRRQLDVDDTAVHAPPVVQRLFGVGALLPGAVQNRTHHLFIEAAPQPNRGSQGCQHTFLTNKIGAVGAKFAVLVAIGGNITVGDDFIATADKVGNGIAGQAAPTQIHLGTGIGQLRTQGKGIDGCGHTVNGGRADIADVVMVGHGAGNGAGDELGLVHPGIVAADAGIGHVHRAVEKPHLLMANGGTGGGMGQLGRGGKHQLRALLHRQLQQAVGLLGRVGKEVAAHLHLVAQRLL